MRGEEETATARRDRLRHGSSFGAQARAYAEHRPGYPGAAIRWALAPVRGRSPLRVLDLGAGTGKLTGGLDRHADAVLALEPDLAMLAELRRALPTAAAAAGRGERIPLRDGSVDAVLAAQSAHWFDLDRAVPEMVRVLAPGGVLAGLWNTDDDRVDWVAGLAEVAPGLASVPLTRWRAGGGDPLSQWLSQDASGATPRGDARGRLGPAEQAEFGHCQTRTAGALAATMATHSTALLMHPAERDRALSRVRAYLSGRPETSSGAFQLPLVTCAMRAVLSS